MTVSTDNGLGYLKVNLERAELTIAAQSAEIARLREAVRDLLPYAEAAIGPSWRANPPSDSVITKARQALQEPRT